LITTAANLFYQFWLHATWLPRLGPLEWILNTPAHHRVHHASNPEYLDANFGGVLIVFDRLFGTFVTERPSVAIRYGLVEPIRSNNPIYIALHQRQLWHQHHPKDFVDANAFSAEAAHSRLAARIAGARPVTWLVRRARSGATYEPQKSCIPFTRRLAQFRCRDYRIE
jgi:hypothetical protein